MNPLNPVSGQVRERVEAFMTGAYSLGQWLNDSKSKEKVDLAEHLATIADTFHGNAGGEFRKVAVYNKLYMLGRRRGA